MRRARKERRGEEVKRGKEEGRGGEAGGRELLADEGLMSEP
jgi:hypothetical protein